MGTVKAVIVPKSKHEGEVNFAVSGVHEVTFVDGESHGQGPVGNVALMSRGRKRLILSSPNITAALLEGEG